MGEAAKTGTNGVEIAGLAKIYGKVAAIDGIDLTVAPGEFVALLGPSGCGKTTLLRAIAGLVAPDRGTIRFGAETILDAGRKIFVPPERRHLGMVFQDYALWPHMRVRDNVGFPLAARKVPKAQHPAMVAAALARVGLADLGERFPGELSGGQQQRVALARAIVDSPRVLLFDEPLSNLDAALRDSLGREIARLARELGATAFYVTHDQSEALSLADRIAILRGGRILCVDTPEKLYRNPPDAWVAGFLRSGSLIPGQVGQGSFRPAGARENLALPKLINGHAGPSTLLLLNGALRIGAESPDFHLSVVTAHFRGEHYEIAARWGEGADAPLLQFGSDKTLRAGEIVPAALDRDRLRLFMDSEPISGGH